MDEWITNEVKWSCTKETFLLLTETPPRPRFDFSVYLRERSFFSPVHCPSFVLDSTDFWWNHPACIFWLVRSKRRQLLDLFIFLSQWRAHLFSLAHIAIVLRSLSLSFSFFSNTFSTLPSFCSNDRTRQRMQCVPTSTQCSLKKKETE